MSEEMKQQSRLEIAHVLFIDIVGYSKLLTNEQRERLQELNRIVRETEQFRAAEVEKKLIRLPTGDGMVLAFFTSPDAPVRCAVASNLKMLLGKKEEAVRIAEQSVREHPISEDAVANSSRLSRLGLMYVYAGERERAMQIFGKLVQLPMAEGVGQYGPLKYNPILDGLRQDPRFEEILKQAQQPLPRL